MRHSRRAVMAERYKLYAKKNIFNSRYLVRNIQVGMLAFVMIAMLIGTIVLITSGSEKEKVVAKKTNKKNTVSVKDALFSNVDTTAESTKAETTEVTTTEEQTSVTTTESIFAEKVQTKLENKIEEVADNVTLKEVVEEPKSEFDNKCIANVDETLNIRKGPGADTEFVGQMNNGAIAIIEGTDGAWTKIKSGDVEGYVLTEYILTGVLAEEFAKNYVTLCGTVLEDGVNIRSEKSTEAEILSVMDKNDVVRVIKETEETKEAAEQDTADDTKVSAQDTSVATETSVVISSTEQTTEIETTCESTASENEVPTETVEEEIEWIPVVFEDGQTGYVSAEFIEIDELYEIAVSAEELQRRAEEEAARKAAEEEAARQAAAQATQSSGNTTSQSTNNTNTSSSDTNQSYEGATTEPVTTKEKGECIGTFTITAYCGCNKCSAGNNKTASGTVPTEGRTIAADTSILPFGTQVVIGGVVYTVEDRGSGVNGNHIDIFFATHERALAFGKKTMKVYKY